MKKIIKEFCDFYKVDPEMISDIELIRHSPSYTSVCDTKLELKITWNKLTEEQYEVKEKLIEKIYKK